MSKAKATGILTGLLLMGMITACNLPTARVSQPETETPIPTASPTDTATSVPTATEFVPPETATPEFVPFCEPGADDNPLPSACQLPIAEQSTVFCTNKVPYNLIFINAGSTYEALTEGFTCSDAGMKDDKQMITCTGPMAASFGLRVCDPACAIPATQVETTQCPQGYSYNAQQSCCSQGLQPLDQNCVVLKLETKSCVVDCSVYTKQSTCENHSNACRWDASNKTCQLRQ
jgi:hypothetical protein